MNNLKDRRSLYSPITVFVRDVFGLLKWLSPMQWLSLRSPSIFRSRAELTPEEIGSRAWTARRARSIELYIMFWIFIEVFLSLSASFGISLSSVRILMALIAAIRAIEIVQVTVNAAIFDMLSGRVDHRVASMPRMVVLAAVNYVELILCFGVVYAADPALMNAPDNPALAFYVSAVTQMGVGYSDVYPTGWLRLVAVIQALSAFFFVIIVLGRFVASLRQIKGLLDD